MKKLVTKIKSWFKPKKQFKEIEQIEQPYSVDPTDSIDAVRYSANSNATKETQAEKMRNLADKKRNNKPFYKDDKAKDWEQ